MRSSLSLWMRLSSQLRQLFYLNPWEAYVAAKFRQFWPPSVACQYIAATFDLFGTITQCPKWPITLKSFASHISKKYLTTNGSLSISIQKKIKSGNYIVRIRIPDPVFRKFETNFFLNCIVANIFPETNFSLKWLLLWVPFMK